MSVFETKLTDILEAILPIEAYVSFDHEVPYTYQYSDARSSVTVVGVNHTHDYPGPVFSLLDTIFTKATPTHVVIEGIDTLFISQTPSHVLHSLTLEEAAHRGGEALYSFQAAKMRKIPVLPAEPPDDALYTYLLSLGFHKPDILAWYVLRLYPQYLRSGEMLPFLEYVEPFLETCKRATRWQQVSYDINDILAHGQSLIGANLTQHNYDVAYSYTDPTAVTRRDNDYTVLNTLSATADVLRDRTMVRRSIEQAHDGQSVLLVCGVAHAVMQEPAYKKFFM